MAGKPERVIVMKNNRVRVLRKAKCEQCDDVFEYSTTWVNGKPKRKYCDPCVARRRRKPSCEVKPRSNKNTIKRSYKGKKYTIRELSNMTGITYEKLYMRIVKQGLSAAKAIAKYTAIIFLLTTPAFAVTVDRDYLIDREMVLVEETKMAVQLAYMCGRIDYVHFVKDDETNQDINNACQALTELYAIDRLK